MPHLSFCLRCRERFPTSQLLRPELFRTKNNRAAIGGIHRACNGNVVRMLSNRDIEQGMTGKGLFSSLKAIGSKVTGVFR